MVDFFDWHMPIMYTSIIEEHLTVRNSVGLFDVSHMGNFNIFGNDALPFLQRIFTTDMALAKKGALRYTHILNEQGKIIDDMICAKLEDDKFFCIPNASMIETDYKWFTRHTSHADEFPDINIENVSDDYAIIALQGPNAASTLQKITSYDLSSMNLFEWADILLESVSDGKKFTVWHSGYTGEDGFELMVKREYAVKVWNELFDAGREYGIKPIGLGARDTLRLEKGFLLSGVDFHEDRTSLETNWNFEWAVDLEGHDFIGKDKLLAQKVQGDYELFVGIELTARGIPRPGYPIVKAGEPIGCVTSGTMIPKTDGTKVGIALGYVPQKYSEPGTEVEIEIRGRAVEGRIAKLP